MTADETKLANTRTVDALQRVYTVLVALALTTAAKLLIEGLGLVPMATPSTQLGDPISTSLMAAAFLSTTVVFYQGMNRHLDDSFVLAAIDERHRGLLLLDVFVFLIEGAILVAMASTINAPSKFLVAWTVLLCTDVIWSLLVYLITRHSTFKWIVNNIAWGVAAWLGWLLMFPDNALFLALIEITRSVVDYSVNWGMYFPRKGQPIPDSTHASA
jgi:hypothetical protein